MKKLIIKAIGGQQAKTFSIVSILWLLLLLIFSETLYVSCKKETSTIPPDTSANIAPVNLALDSLRATKKTIVVWEEIFITAYARGKNLSFSWSANHGSMLGEDSVTVKYWACPSCIGLNTVECVVSNEYGSLSDTIMIRVNH